MPSEACMVLPESKWVVESRIKLRRVSKAISLILSTMMARSAALMGDRVALCSDDFRFDALSIAHHDVQQSERRQVQPHGTELPVWKTQNTPKAPRVPAYAPRTSGYVTHVSTFAGAYMTRPPLRLAASQCNGRSYVLPPRSTSHDHDFCCCRCPRNIHSRLLYYGLGGRLFLTRFP